MKPFLGLILLTLAAACSSPSPRYLGVPAVEQVVSGVRFDVYQRGESAQAIRLHGRLPEGLPAIKLAAIHAIEAATGCTVKRSSVEGDLEVINASLSC